MVIVLANILKAWAISSGHQNLYAMINEDKSIDLYLDEAERRHSLRISQAEASLRAQEQSRQPDQLLIQNYRKDIEESKWALAKIADYKAENSTKP